MSEKEMSDSVPSLPDRQKEGPAHGLLNDYMHENTAKEIAKGQVHVIGSNAGK